MSLVFADSDEQGRQEYGQSEIISGTFWPRIDLSDLRNVMRIDTNVSSSRLYHAAIDGVAHVNGQLRAWKKQAQQNSISSLHELDDPEDYINGESVRVSYYRRASIATQRRSCLKRGQMPKQPAKVESVQKQNKIRPKTIAAKHILLLHH